MRIGAAQVDLTRFTVTHSGRPLRLTPQEVAILRVFVRAASVLDDGRMRATVSREVLFADGMGYRSPDQSRALDYAIRRLRSKLDDLSAKEPALETLRGEGYRLTWTANPGPTAAGPPTFGRQGWPRRIDHALSPYEVCTLVGPPGVGKSHLARWWASHQEGVAWLRPGSPLSAAPRLVIDQCETDLTTARAMVEEARQRGQQVVCTSRRRLGVLNEHPIAVDPLPREAAHELLRHHAFRAGAPLPTDLELDALCDACDDLPLAIILIAGRLRSLPAARLVARLHTNAPDPDPLDAAIELAWADLSPDARTTLTGLAVHPSLRFAWEDLEATVPSGADTDAVIESLVEHGLLTTILTTEHGLRYHLLRPLRRAIRRRPTGDGPGASAS